MKPSSLPLLFGCAILLQGCASSSSTHHHPPLAQPAPVPVNGSPAKILSEVERHFQQLAVSIANQNPREVHQHDQAIRTLLSNLTKIANSEAERDVSAQVREIAEAARAAHHSAHEDEWTEAAAHAKRGQASLAALKESFKTLPGRS